MNANEAVGRDPAFQERPELLLDELRRRLFVILLSQEERFELFSDDAIEDRFFRFTRKVFKRRALHAPTLCRLDRLRKTPKRPGAVTCGVTEAVIAALLGIVNPGEKVVVLEPAHENYHAGIAFAGGIPVWIPLRPPHYRFDAEELARAFQQKPKAVLFNSPHNPSGRVFTEQDLSTLFPKALTV